MDQMFQDAWGLLIKGVAGLLMTGVTWLLGVAILYLQKKKSITVSEGVKKAILDAAGVGISRAEEWGLQQGKKIATAISTPDAKVIEPPTGEMKQKIAKETASLISPEFRKLDESAQAAMLDAKLYQMRTVSLLPGLPARSSIAPASLAPPADLSGRAGTIPRAAPVPHIEEKGG